MSAPQKPTKFLMLKPTNVNQVHIPKDWCASLFLSDDRDARFGIDSDALIEFLPPGAAGPTTVKATFNPNSGSNNFLSSTRRAVLGIGDSALLGCVELTGKKAKFRLLAARPGDQDLDELVAAGFARAAQRASEGDSRRLDDPPLSDTVLYSHPALLAAMRDSDVGKAAPELAVERIDREKGRMYAAAGAERPGRGVDHYVFCRDLWARSKSCAFCGCTVDRALEFAHILPWSASESNQRRDADNGLVLCASHHRLFDAHLLRLLDSLEIEVAHGGRYRSATDKPLFDGLHGKAVRVSNPEATKAFAKARRAKLGL